MLQLRFSDELGEQIREVDTYVVIFEDRFVRIIFTPFEAVCFSKQTNVIRFCCATISEALVRLEPEVQEIPVQKE